jgi:hypothetical protein
MAVTGNQIVKSLLFLVDWTVSRRKQGQSSGEKESQKRRPQSRNFVDVLFVDEESLSFRNVLQHRYDNDRFKGG